MRSLLEKRKKVVLKIGSSVLTDEQGKLKPSIFRSLAKEISFFVKKGIKFTLVSSGAIAAGLDKFAIKSVPTQIHKKQAIAAAGQITLMREYETAFSKQGLKIAQVLLNREDLANRHRFLNARHTLFELGKNNVIPIINENDTLSVEEIKFGDNDNLSAWVTNVVEADLLILLTDIDGLYTQDPRTSQDAKHISILEELTETTFSFASGTLRVGSTGGMKTKLTAAAIACHFGVPIIIASGKEKNILSRLLSADDVGTLILPKAVPRQVKSRKHWIAHMQKVSGKIQVDEGARKALVEKGKSLLASGVKDIKGSFEIGDAIEIYVEGEKSFARGLTSYASEELKKILGCKTSEIEKVLGYKYSNAVIHRDDLVLL